MYFISDLQAPMFFESLILKTYKNTIATAKLLDDIYNNPPKTLFLLGDNVSIASRDSEWKQVDTFLKKYRAINLPFYSIPGNHEYKYRKKRGLKNFSKRFPGSNLYFSSHIVDSIAVVLINSSELDKNKIVKEYKKELDKLDENPAVKIIIVATHHPPFTNSKIVSAEKDVRDKILPHFFKSSKAKLYLSGHSHNLEYFQKNGKDFLVIGGGGGIQQPLKKMKKRKWKDLIPDKDKPLYFYLIIKRVDNKIFLRTKGFKKDFKFYEQNLFEIEM